MYFRVQSSSTISMCEIYLRWNVFVRLYAFRLKDHISIGNCTCKCGSCQSLNRVLELEGVCFAEIDRVVAKNNEAIEAAEGLAEPPLCINTASRVPRCSFESLGSSDCIIPV